MYNVTVCVKYPGDVFVLSREPVEIMDYIRRELKPYCIYPILDEQDLARSILRQWLDRKNMLWNNRRQVVH